MKIRVNEVPHWNKTDIHVLKLSMLKQALGELADRRMSPRIRKEAIDWLFEENLSNPFNARECARAGGYDIDRLRDNLQGLIRHLKIA